MGNGGGGETQPVAQNKVSDTENSTENKENGLEEVMLDVRKGKEIKVLGRDFHLKDVNQAPSNDIPGRKYMKARRRRGKMRSAEEKEDDQKAAKLISQWMQNSNKAKL